MLAIQHILNIYGNKKKKHFYQHQMETHKKGTSLQWHQQKLLIRLRKRLNSQFQKLK